MLKLITIKELTEQIESPMTETEEKGLLDVEKKEETQFLTGTDVWKILTSLCGATTWSEFQALTRPMQKHYLWEVYELGIGPRVLSLLTGVPYSIVKRATTPKSKTPHRTDMLREQSPEDELWRTYLDDGEFEKSLDC